jgi:hypothetical protein
MGGFQVTLVDQAVTGNRVFSQALVSWPPLPWTTSLLVCDAARLLCTSLCCASLFIMLDRQTVGEHIPAKSGSFVYASHSIALFLTRWHAFWEHCHSQSCIQSAFAESGC